MLLIHLYSSTCYDTNGPSIQGQSLAFNVPFEPLLDAPFPYPPVVYPTYQFPNQNQRSATELKRGYMYSLTQ
jgi:hypothetical protein